MKAVFLSYTGRDSLGHTYACTLASLLQARDIPTWIATQNLPPACSWRGALAGAIDSAACVVAILSRDYCGSDWCIAEIERAAARGIPVLPFKVDPQSDLWGRMRELLGGVQWVDLTQWAPYQRHPIAEVRDWVTRQIRG